MAYPSNSADKQMEQQRQGTILEFFKRQLLNLQHERPRDEENFVQCPVCNLKLPEKRINHHLDWECTLGKSCDESPRKIVGDSSADTSNDAIVKQHSLNQVSTSVKPKDTATPSDSIIEGETTSSYFQHDKKRETEMTTPPLGQRFFKMPSPRQSLSPARRRLSLTDARFHNLGKTSCTTTRDELEGSAAAGADTEWEQSFSSTKGKPPVNVMDGISRNPRKTYTPETPKKGSEEGIVEPARKVMKVEIQQTPTQSEQSHSEQALNSRSPWKTACYTSPEKLHCSGKSSPKCTLTLRKNEFATPLKVKHQENFITPPKTLPQKEDYRSPARSSPVKSSITKCIGSSQIEIMKKGLQNETDILPTPSKRKRTYSTPKKSPHIERTTTDNGTQSPSSCSGLSSSRTPQQSPRKKRLIEKIPNCFKDLKTTLQSPTKDVRRELKFGKSPLKLMSENSDEVVEIPDYSDADSLMSKQDFGQLCYYLNNFLQIIQSVLNVPDDLELFNEEDLKILRRFYMLSEQGQELFVRLIARKFNWIKKPSIKYPEIADDLQPVFDELTEAGFIESEENLSDLKTMLLLLSSNSIKVLCQYLNIKTTSQKKSSVAELMAHCARQPTILEMMGSSSSVKNVVFEKAKRLLGPCFRLNDEVRRVFIRIMMLYSLTDTVSDDSQKDDAPTQLTTLLMINMGRWIFPPYRTFRKTKIFRSRVDLLEYEKAFLLEADIVAAIEAKDWNGAAALCNKALAYYNDYLTQDIKDYDISLPRFLRRFTTGHILTRSLNQRVEMLQKKQMYEEANEQLRELLKQYVYCQSYRGHWTERLALNLDQHLKQPLMALEIITSALEDEQLTTNHNFALYQRACRILSSKKYKQKIKDYLKEMPAVTLTNASECHIKGNVIRKNIPGCRTLFSYKEPSESGNDVNIVICTVEEMALAHYRKQGYPDGIHGEGAALVSLFGLLFWDVIYSPGVPDAFRSSHQSIPLDLMSHEFYENRKAAIDERIRLLKILPAEELADRVGQSWRSHEGQASLVSWELYGSYQNTQSLVTCIGSECLAQICECFAKKYRHLRSGIPDLTVWNPVTKEWKMVEVKGPGDRLSVKQRVWLDYLIGIGVQVEVCYIKGSKTIKKATQSVPETVTN